jgi:hypothetical protein
MQLASKGPSTAFEPTAVQSGQRNPAPRRAQNPARLGLDLAKERARLRPWTLSDRAEQSRVSEETEVAPVVRTVFVFS